MTSDCVPHEDVKRLLEKLESKAYLNDPKLGLQLVSDSFSGQVVFSSSLGWEDQLITHLICENKVGVEIFTIDTGRLFEEAYNTLDRTVKKYQIPIKVYFPNTNKVEQLLHTKGPNSFYASVENRKECCHIRKVEPLRRALKGKKVWITGLRKEQSDNRADKNIIEWDKRNNIIKYHPLFFWTKQEVIHYVKKKNIPYNPLHDRNYPSIGCEPCTRAVLEGEDDRAGRWWWEVSKKECGLHS